MDYAMSTAEQNFLCGALSRGQRMDRRERSERRSLEVTFGEEWGVCNVQLGNSRVVTVVSCEVVAPKMTRPHEGSLVINVEMAPTAAPWQDMMRNNSPSTHIVLEVTRLLEKAIKESTSVDLESLCLQADKAVWMIRADVHILNADGSLPDCASMSAVGALMHFRRPDASNDGDKLVIHSPRDRDPVPLSLKHLPILISFAIQLKAKSEGADGGDNNEALHVSPGIIYVDPTEMEEAVCDSIVRLSANQYGEVCAVHLGGGKTQVSTDQLFQCIDTACKHVKSRIAILENVLQADTAARELAQKTAISGENHIQAHIRPTVQVHSCLENAGGPSKLPEASELHTTEDSLMYLDQSIVADDPKEGGWFSNSMDVAEQKTVILKTEQM